MMVDFTQPKSEVEGQISNYRVKADGQVEDAYVFETDVVFKIDTVEAARVLEKMLPGAVEVFERASDEQTNWKFRTSVTPDIKGGITAVMSNSSRGKIAVEGGCDVKTIRVVASKKSMSAIVKLAWGGQTASKAANLTELLRSACLLSTELRQVALFANNSATNGTGGRAPEKGDIVVAYEDGTAYVGRVAEFKESGALVLEDFDNTYSVEVDEITAVIKLEGDVAALRRSYKTRATRRKLTPTWEAVVMAAGQTVEGLLGGGKFELTAKIIEAAVGLLEGGDSSLPELPPEPGEVAAT